jgi:pyruvyl transferase EpsI
MHKIKKIIPASTKARILYNFRSSKDICYDPYNKSPKVIIALAADYPNLGDVAITYAQAQFIKTILPEHEIVFFPCAATFLQMKALKYACSPKDIITIVGGGNMGDLYDSLEDARRFIIQNFHHNKIISFPQSIDFSDTPKGRRKLRKTKRAYRRHPNLHLFAREPVSFKKMKRFFPANPVYLVPDIVLAIDSPKGDQSRRGVLLCIRDDAESALSAEGRSNFINLLVASIKDISVVDTMSTVADRLAIAERVSELETVLFSFRSSKVVVTDRLHGMIFSAITNTPCLVLLNNNHKIRATYNAWLTTLPHIRLQENFDPEQALRSIEELRNHSKEIKIPHFGEQYESLKRVIAAQGL